MGDEARGGELVAGEALRRQRIQEPRPALGGVADPEVRGRTRIEAALPQESPTGVGLGRHQLGAEPLGGGGVGGVKPCAPRGLGNRTAAVLVVQRDAHARRHTLDGFGEREVVHLPQEGVDVAGLSAAEAVVEADLGSHVEAGAALVVEGAETLHRPHARGFERDPLTDDVGDVDARLHLVDIGLDDAPCHQSAFRDAPERPAAGTQMPRDAASTSPTSLPCQAMATWSVRLAT